MRMKFHITIYVLIKNFYHTSFDWAVLPLDQLVKHSIVPYWRWSSTIFLPTENPCLTAVRKDGLGPSQAPPITISPLQLLSYGVVQATDYEATISSSR